jgi:hypothetical protein
VDGFGYLKGCRGTVVEGKLQGPGRESAKVVGERGEPTKPLLRSLTKTLKGTHDSKRGGQFGGDAGADSWTTILRYL